MALVEKYHVVASSHAVATGQTIKEGQVVSLNTAGEVVIQGASFPTPFGIAGDTKSTTASSMPGIASGWQNRVSDYFDETKASSKMTVYHSGGEFATDMFAANVAAVNPMTTLFCRNGYLDTKDQNAATADAYKVAILTLADGTYPSGVPGIDLNGDQALAGGLAPDVNGDLPATPTNTYIEFKLVI